MGTWVLSELLATLGEVKKSSQKWGKHTNTLHLLADQIMGLERYEFEKLKIPEDSCNAVRCTIQYKITEELKCLSDILSGLEAQNEALSSAISKMESECQALLESKSCSRIAMSELQLLQPAYSLHNHLSVLISMKRIPLHNASVDNFKTLQDFKQMNQTTKSVETELGKLLMELELQVT